MQQVMRYKKVSGGDGYADMMAVRPDGRWVKAQDYDALAATVIEQQAEIERLTDRAEKAEVDAEFFKGEVKLRNRISVTSEGMANLQFQLESANAEIERLREATMDAAKIAESCAPSDEWAEETKDTYLFAVRDVARAIRKHYHDRAATNALGNIAHAMKDQD